MKLRGRHVWKGPRRLLWRRAWDVDHDLLAVVDRCAVCGETWRTDSIVAPESIDDPQSRAFVEEHAQAAAERAFSRAWCYPNPGVRRFVRWAQPWLERLLAFRWKVRRWVLGPEVDELEDDPPQAQHGQFRHGPHGFEPVEGWPEPPAPEGGKS